MKMTERHPVRHVVQVSRNNTVVHVQEAPSRSDAEQMKNRFEAIPRTTVEIVEVHDPHETDLTSRTREIVADIAGQART